MISLRLKLLTQNAWSNTKPTSSPQFQMKSSSDSSQCKWENESSKTFAEFVTDFETLIKYLYSKTQWTTDADPRRWMFPLIYDYLILHTAQMWCCLSKSSETLKKVLMLYYLFIYLLCNWCTTSMYMCNFANKM